MLSQNQSQSRRGRGRGSRFSGSITWEESGHLRERSAPSRGRREGSIKERREEGRLSRACLFPRAINAPKPWATGGCYCGGVRIWIIPTPLDS
ncbi:hypothetical protein ACLOJK_004690 [Asimina triloba]